ncbi:hypothetical protein PAXRUDRAFT_829402 [Paxillus rubicundulus Ve08.2h10]|uniref:Ams2/SPT21 N-terminal domain-containing protein n=1 Tax=Paxillus rubicundulus Ve08.2h10 TaxID=930991 RepID=A0A0D0E615_9AGAM|nr:hypothetical protein PAXRUDRAFT_829402 [Paxillus rubicundulus Ve08.2h10]
MDATTHQVFLRVLYTINSSPQYILARSSVQVPTILYNGTRSQSSASEPQYAQASLKACLVAVCNSSPELLHDPERDFSLYVLDPLEAQPVPSHMPPESQCTKSPHGVAVALGLMSWALESDASESVYVTGAIVPNLGPSSSALEVIFALREVCLFHLTNPTSPSSVLRLANKELPRTNATDKTPTKGCFGRISPLMGTGICTCPVSSTCFLSPFSVFSDEFIIYLSPAIRPTRATYTYPLIRFPRALHRSSTTFTWSS